MEDAGIKKLEFSIASHFNPEIPRKWERRTSSVVFTIRVD